MSKLPCLFCILLLISGLRSRSDGKENSLRNLNERILSGWNTWDNRSVLTQVLLPQGLALAVQIHDTLSGDSLIYAFTGNRVAGAGQQRPFLSLGRFTGDDPIDGSGILTSIYN